MSAIMKLMASKLGLKDENTALSKACEFERLLKIKMTGTSNLNDYARAIICLDVATDCLGIPFDTELGIKLSALKKSLYANSKHNVKKILELETGVSINSLCVQLGCTQAATLANTILERFKTKDVKICDLEHPQYSCMAVYQACRIEKIKVAKNKFISHSRLKPSQWSELETEWTKLVNTIVADTGVNIDNKKQSKGVSIAQKICDSVEATNKRDKDNKDNTNSLDKIEDFEVWKTRILQEAYKELENMKSANTIRIGNTESGGAIPKIDREKGVRLVFK